MIALKLWRELLLLILIVVIYFCAFYIQKLQSESVIDKQNISALTTDMKIVVGMQGENIAEVKGLQYTLSEFKDRESELTQTINSMKIKPKNVVSVSQIAINNAVQAKIPLKDSIKRLPLFIDTIRCFQYADKYNRINGCMYGDSVDLMSNYSDTLVIIPNIINKYKFLWWSWGNKGIKLDAFLSNPSSNITFAKYIEIR